MRSIRVYDVICLGLLKQCVGLHARGYVPRTEAFQSHFRAY